MQHHQRQLDGEAWIEQGDRRACAACGLEVRNTPGKARIAHRCGPRPWPKRGLGAWLTRQLARLGIRAEVFAGRTCCGDSIGGVVVLSPRGCRCTTRAEWLDRAGWRLLGWLRAMRSVLWRRAA